MATSCALDSYLAGIFDGEGCITAYIVNDNRLRITVSVGMCAREPIVLFYNKFGGLLSDGNRKTASGKQIYNWQTVNGQAFQPLLMLSNYCLVKKPIIDQAIKIAGSMANNTKSHILSFTEKQMRLEAALAISAMNNNKGPRSFTLSDDCRVQKYMASRSRGARTDLLVTAS